MTSLSDRMQALRKADLRLSDYDYTLPEALIARYPLEKRDESRMLVINRQSGTLSHHRFYELPGFLNPDDLVVLNNTKVLPARFFGHRLNSAGEPHTGKVEVLLLNPDTADDTIWTAMMRPAKKLPPGRLVAIPGSDSRIEILERGTGGRGSPFLAHGDGGAHGRRLVPPALRRQQRSLPRLQLHRPLPRQP